MIEIRVEPMLLAGLATFVAFVGYCQVEALTGRLRR